MRQRCPRKLVLEFFAPTRVTCPSRLVHLRQRRIRFPLAGAANAAASSRMRCNRKLPRMPPPVKNAAGWTRRKTLPAEGRGKGGARVPARRIGAITHGCRQPRKQSFCALNQPPERHMRSLVVEQTAQQMLPRPHETSVGRRDSPARSPQERRRRHTDEQAKHCKQRTSGTCKPGFDLEASSRAAQTPFAEVLTVIGQQPIALFPHTGSCSADDLSNVEVGWRLRSHPDALSAREISERNFFHRSSAQTVREPRVVNDLASTDVDAVMQIAAPRCDKVRTQRGFLVPDQEPVATELPAR
jgi:hypothetical protein